VSLDLKAEEISSYTWDWIKTTYNIPHGNAQETGITSYLIYELFKETHTASALGMLLSFNRIGAKEAISGADFFMIIESNGVIYKLLIQAKRLTSAKIRPFIQNTYSSFNRMVERDGKELYQYFLLLRYINSSKCPEGTIPYYLFYNSSFDQPDTISSLVSHPISHKNNFLCDIDSKYSYSLNNKEVFGTLLTNAYNFINLFNGIPISPSIKKLINPSFEDVLNLDTTVTLQEFIREISFIPPSTGGPGSTGGTGGPGSTGGAEDSKITDGSDSFRNPRKLESIENTNNTGKSDDDSSNELESKQYNEDNHLFSNVYIKQKVIENIKMMIKGEKPNDYLEEDNNYINLNNNKLLKEIDFDNLMDKYEVNLNFKNEPTQPKLKDLTNDSIKDLNKLDDKPELKKQVLDILENNYDRLPMYILSLD